MNVHIHSDAVGKSTGVARVERAGHITTALLGELIAEIAGLKIRVQPVIDLPTLAPADAYVPTAVMRTATMFVWPHSASSFSSLPSEGLDLDHSVAFLPGGCDQTSLDNLAPLERRPHRAKTLGVWQLEHPSPAVVIWTSPLGVRYLVTPFGTTRIDDTLGKAELAAFGEWVLPDGVAQCAHRGEPDQPRRLSRASGDEGARGRVEVNHP